MAGNHAHGRVMEEDTGGVGVFGVGGAVWREIYACGAPNGGDVSRGYITDRGGPGIHVRRFENGDGQRPFRKGWEEGVQIIVGEGELILAPFLNDRGGRGEERGFSSQSQH